MSLRSKAFIAAAALTMAVAAGSVLATPGTAHSATKACGNGCVNIYQTAFGRGFQLDAFQQRTATGTPIILFASSSTDPGQDFAVVDLGTVLDAYEAGLVTPQLTEYYSKQEAYEIDFAPNGIDIGECVGASATPADGTTVSLQPCGVSSQTIWVSSYIGGSPSNGNATPLINGANLDFWQPKVLTYPTGASPAEIPRPQLIVSSIPGFQDGPVDPGTGSIGANQLWAGYPGVV